MEKVLLEEFVEQTPCRDSQRCLRLEVIDVLGGDVGEVANCQEQIVGIDHISAERAMFIVCGAAAQRLTRQAIMV